MLSPNTQSASVIDSLNGSMEDWFAAIDACIKKSDVIPGNYEYTVNTSYGNVGKIVEGSSTHFDISCDRFKIISLENSYITMKQTVKINIPNLASNATPTYYIGYKSAYDAIASYRVYSNSDHVQTQNHANYEWFMMYNSVSDEVKEQSDCYATFKKINDMNPFVPGCYVKTRAGAAHDCLVTFNLKIPLNSFLMLYNLKYYPDWAGKITIEIYPSFRNIVIIPVIGTNEYVLPAAANSIRSIYDVTDANGITRSNVGFTNINQTDQLNAFTTNFAAAASLNITANGDGCFVDDCKIRLATYLLKVQVATALAAKYANIPLIFPIQTTQIKDFTSALPVTANTHFTTANTIALKHCGSMFIVFKNGVHARTCFNNPFINNFRVNVDGKFYPREELHTYDDQRFINLTLDALNLNNNTITSISRDLATSLQPYTTLYNRTGVATNAAAAVEKIWKLGDYSNFMIGVPFCDSDDFMGGLSTIGTVQIELSGIRSDIANTREYLVTAICFEDCYLKIRSIKPDGRSQIEITNATIEQMSLGGL